MIKYKVTFIYLLLIVSILLLFGCSNTNSSKDTKVQEEPAVQNQPVQGSSSSLQPFNTKTGSDNKKD